MQNNTPIMIELPELKLPSSEELENYRTRRKLLENDADALSPEQKRAFCELVLVDPGCIDPAEVKLVEKFAPDLWKAYCNCHWGPPEERLRSADE